MGCAPSLLASLPISKTSPTFLRNPGHRPSPPSYTTYQYRRGFLFYGLSSAEPTIARRRERLGGLAARQNSRTEGLGGLVTLQTSRSKRQNRSLAKYTQP